MLLPQMCEAVLELRAIRFLRNSRMVQAAAIAVVLGATAWLSLRAGTVHDFDIWWHLRTGELILQHHFIPQCDSFSIFGMGKPWVAYSWLCEVVFAVLVRMAGLAGLVFYAAAMRLLIAIAVFDLIRRLQPSFWKAWSLTAAVLYAMGPSYGPRPALFSILFFIVQLDILAAARRTRNSRLLFFLPPVYLFWANLHVQLIYGLFALGLLTYEATLNDWLRGVVWEPDAPDLPAGHMWLCTAACFGTTFLNPYSARLYLAILGLAGQTGQWEYVSELLSPSFRQGSHYIALFLFLIAAGVMAYRRLLRPVPIMLFVVCLLLGFRSARDLWLAIIIGATLICGWTGIENAGYRLTRAQTCSVLAVLIMGLTISARLQISNVRIYQEMAKEFPLAATQHLRQRGVHGPLFNDFDWGGFLIWALPGMPVSMDGRTNLYGDNRVVRNMNTWDARPEWNQDPDLATARLIIANRKASLTSVLRLCPKYRRIYEDDLAVIFQADNNGPPGCDDRH